MNNGITVLYGTMTGNARECADQVVATLGKADIAGNGS